MDIKLSKVRLSFPDLFVTREFKPGDGKPRYSASFLIVPGSENDKKIREAIHAEAVAVYGKKAEANLKAFAPQTNKFAYTDGNLKTYDGYEDMWVLACHAKTRPLVLDRDKTPLTADDGRPYAGCYVNAVVSIYAQQGENPGIRGSFSGVQFHSDAEAFGGGKPASSDDFDEVPDEGASAEDIF